MTYKEAINEIKSTPLYRLQHDKPDKGGALGQALDVAIKALMLADSYEDDGK